MGIANRCLKMGQRGRKEKMVCIWEDKEEPNEGGKRVGKRGRRRGKDEQPGKKKKDGKEEEKINLLLFWTDTQKYNQLHFVCPGNPEIVKT